MTWQTKSITMEVQRGEMWFVARIDGLPALRSDTFANEESASRDLTRAFKATYRAVCVLPYNPKKILPGLWAIEFLSAPMT